MSNHHLPYSDSDTEFLERQQALSSNPTYQLNNVSREERDRLTRVLAASFEPHSLVAKIAIGIGKAVLAALCIFSVWALIAIVSMEVR